MQHHQEPGSSSEQKAYSGGVSQTLSEARETAGSVGRSAMETAKRAAESVRSKAQEAGFSGREGSTTKAIESYTSQIPSGTYLSFALGAMALSALLQVAGKRETSNFVGQWVPTILIMGLYNKLVKVEGSE